MKKALMHQVIGCLVCANRMDLALALLNETPHQKFLRFKAAMQRMNLLGTFKVEPPQKGKKHFRIYMPDFKVSNPMLGSRLENMAERNWDKLERLMDMYDLEYETDPDASKIILVRSI